MAEWIKTYADTILLATAIFLMAILLNCRMEKLEKRLCKVEFQVFKQEMSDDWANRSHEGEE